MTEFMKTQNSFADGEVSAEFFIRDNLNGLSRLENMDVIAGGGLRRRRGLQSFATLNSSGRLIPFSVSESENYLLALIDGHLKIYNNSELVRDLLVIWDFADIEKIQYAQRFGTMIFVHPDYRPYVLTKTDSGFQLSEFAFEVNDADMFENMPFMKFDDATGVKITVTKNSAGNNYATFTTNKDFWRADNVGTRIMLLDKQWQITEYTSPTVVTAYTNSQYTLPSKPVSDWSESAFSARRGWPCSITFHQDRLVFGGSKSWPSGIWMSCVGRHNNFNVGTGLDDEAIFLTLISEQRQQICTVVSSDNLQILTNVGEWAISSKPLTPSVVDVKQHTAVGSVASRYLPPQKIEGATVFISNTEKDIRELSLDALGENYNARDLCAASKHLMNTPIDLSYNEDTRQLYVVMINGDMATLNQNSALGISAWARYKTAGQFKSVATIGGVTYVIVQRGEEYCLERFSDDALNDADSYDFAYTAASLPLHASGHNVRTFRIRKISARILNTKTLFINGTRVEFPNEIYASDSNGYTGDVSVNLLGTHHNGTVAPWVISSDEQFPATILSVSMSGSYMV
jgi:hypothetical protein